MDYKEIKKNIRILRDQTKKTAAEYFWRGTENIFKKYPNLESFAWTQYTDYFNDGDTCYFSAHWDYAMEINGLNINEIQYRDKPCLQYKRKAHERSCCEQDGEKLEFNTEIINNVDNVKRDIKEFLSVFENVDFQDMFGDHVKVIVNKDGIKTESYENHD